MGDECTRRCRFCDVGQGARSRSTSMSRANLAPRSLAELAYVVITSVDRDDLRDGGGGISSIASGRSERIRRARRSRR